MEEHVMSPALPDAGMCGCDREIFERVWRRVMPGGMEDSPIRLTDGEQRTPEQELVPVPAVPEPMRRGTSPDRTVLCLGHGSAGYAPMLQQMMDGEAEDARLYQSLARRTAGSAGRMLASMAADERRHVKRLAAALFLITGQRSQPRGQEGGRPVPELMEGLREQFIQEQREAAAYESAAADNTDPCLRQLFRELAQEEGMHARLIRSLLEQL